MWAHTAMAAESTLIVSRVVGKRPQGQTRALGQDAKRRRRPGHLPALCTDASEGAASAICEACGRRYPAPPSATGRSRPPGVRWPQGWADGQGKKHEQGRGIERVEGRGVHGTARRTHVLSLLGSKVIKTRVGERHHGTSRLHHQRKARKTLALSTAMRSHRGMRGRAVGL